MLQRNGKPPTTPKPIGPNLRTINGAGRVQLYAIQVSRQATVLVYNLYGWTNGNTCKEASDRTNSLFQAILEDIALQPPGPVLVMGDINGDPDTFPDLQQAICTHSLLDVGAQAHRWGQVASDYTCRAQGTKQPTRRDYIFANTQAYNLITHFEVDHQAGLLVHDPLILHLTTTQQHTYTINQPHKPLSLNTLCVKHMAKQYGPPPSPADKKGADSGGTGQANPHQPCPPSHTQPFSHLHTTVPTNPQGEALWEAMEANIDTSDIAAATPATTRQQYPEEQRTEYLRAIHATMDQQFEAQATAMQQALDKKDLDAFMETWAQAFEDGVFAHVLG